MGRRADTNLYIYGVFDSRHADDDNDDNDDKRLLHILCSSLRPIPTNEHLNRLYYAAEHRATHVIMEIAGA